MRSLIAKTTESTLRDDEINLRRMQDISKPYTIAIDNQSIENTVLHNFTEVK